MKEKRAHRPLFLCFEHIYAHMLIEALFESFDALNSVQITYFLLFCFYIGTACEVEPNSKLLNGSLRFVIIEQVFSVLKYSFMNDLICIEFAYIFQFNSPNF